MPAADSHAAIKTLERGTQREVVESKPTLSTTSRWLRSARAVGLKVSKI